MGGIQIDGQRLVARTGPSAPGSGQHFLAHPIQLARVTPAETPQEGAQCGRRLDCAAQHPCGLASAQCIGIVNAVTTSQRRRHQRQQLVSPIGPARRIPQIDMAVHQLAQSQTMG